MVAVPNGGERVVIHPSDWIEVAESVQLRHPLGRHAVSGRARLAQRQGQLGRRRRHDDADARRCSTTPAQILKAAGHVVRQRRLVARVHHRRHEVPGDEQGLPDLLPEGSAGARDGRRAADGAAVPGRDHADGVAPAEARVHDAGRRRHARQAERDPQQRHQGRQPPVCVGHPRQQRRDQRQHRSADRRDPEPRRPHAQSRRLRLGACRRRDRLHHRRQELRRDEQAATGRSSRRTSRRARRCAPAW